jgi:hypothetical protein
MRETFRRDKFTTQFRARESLFFDQQYSRSLQRELNCRACACGAGAGDSYVENIGRSQRQFSANFLEGAALPPHSAERLRLSGF